MKGSPPLRFLALVLGGWAALRTVLVAPWPAPPAEAAPAPAPAHIKAQAAPDPGLPVRQAPAQPAAGRAGSIFAAAIPPLSPATRQRPRPTAAALLSAPAGMSLPKRRAIPAPAPLSLPPDLALPRRDSGASSPRRWSLSAWSFVRPGRSPSLAPAGLLGASQAGARLSWRLTRDSAEPLALSFRFSAPLHRPAGAEAALGLDWKPIGRLPVHLLAERRQALGREGRSAFGVTAFGGVGDLPLGRFRIDAYAQAGAVGARSRDLFADGSIRLSLPLDRKLRLGAGAWGAVQPGLARLDLGPHAALRLPVANRAVTLAADWRLRVAGNAEPGSGPSLTVATDF